MKQKKIKSSGGKIRNLNDELTRLRSEISRLQHDKEDLYREAKSVAKNRSTVLADLTQRNGELNELTTQIEVLTTELLVGKLMGSWDDSSEENNFEESIRKLKEKKQIKNSFSTAQRDLFQKLTKQYDGAMKAVSMIIPQIEEREVSIRDIKIRIHDLQQEIGLIRRESKVIDASKNPNNKDHSGRTTYHLAIENVTLLKKNLDEITNVVYYIKISGPKGGIWEKVSDNGVLKPVKTVKQAYFTKLFNDNYGKEE